MKLWESIDWPTIEHAFLTANWQNRAYFDVVTGSAQFVTERTRGALQQIYDEVGETAVSAAQLDEILQAAHEIEMDDERFRSLPTVESKQLALWRDGFAAGCEPAFQRLVWSTLDRNDQGAFERMLQIEPEEVERWRGFLSAEIQSHLNPWLQLLRAELEEFA